MSGLPAVLIIERLLTSINVRVEMETQKIIQSGRALLARLLGERSNEFTLQAIGDEGGRPVYEVEARGGKMTISGSSAGAIARGAYDYLRNGCHCMVTWSGARIELPARLPDFAARRVVCPYQFVQYYNCCAFGYSTPFWDWNQWQRELDWMALHGINMPLAMDGQEAIWQRLWKSYGLTDAELAEHFAGPAHLPWQRMGNINHHDGPLPQSFIEQKRQLQHQILGRMRELGMEPIVPAFSGHVPGAFRRVMPDAKVFVLDADHWAKMPRTDDTFVLSPAETDLFIQIGKRFIEEYRREYGEARYYLADTFNEIEVPVTAEGRYDELAMYGKTIYNSIVAGDSEAIWVMQAWLFYFGRHFWDKASAQALLKDVPDDRMLLIDLANEQYHGWKEHDAFYGKGWIYSIVHNFGGNNTVFGPLPLIARDPAEAMASPNRGKLMAFGISPEGIESNEVVYELLTDVSWSGQEIDLKGWLREYCLARYGGCPAQMEQAWELMIQSVYNQSRANKYRWQRRPSMGSFSSMRLSAKFDEAVELFLACRKELGGSGLYVNDVVDFAGQVVGAQAERLLLDAAQLDLAGQTQRSDEFAALAFELLGRLDRLVASRPDMHLERWIRSARSFGTTAAECDYLESNARRLVTLWGGTLLSEYSARVWSGLIRDYYLPRWKQTLASKRSGQAFDLMAWEEKWVMTPGGLSQVTPPADPVADAVELIAMMQDLPRADELKGIFGIAVGKPVSATGGSKTHPRMRAELAVDGNASDREVGWWADTSPQSIRVDLCDDPKAADYAEAMGMSQTKHIGRVDIYNYWDGTRYYQYTIEVSRDAKNWTQVVDMSGNVKAATAAGDSHRFEPVDARYVRVNLLKNSAGPEVHLAEVRVFEA